MSNDQDFQVIVSSQEYQKLKSHEIVNLKLNEDISSLSKQISTLKLRNKDLTRTVYVRDSFIQYLTDQCKTVFANVLHPNISVYNLEQSIYQNMVEHQQNGITSIELREALELYLNKYENIFKELNQVQNLFNELTQTIKEINFKNEPCADSQILLDLQKNKQQSTIQKIQKWTDDDFPKPEQYIPNVKQELNKSKMQLESIQKKVEKLEQQKQKLDTETERLKIKNADLNKEIETLSKKKQLQGEKSYMIRLMVDDYFRQLQKNLGKIGGLTQAEIGSVIGNQLKGVVHYIDNLVRKVTEGKL